MNKEQQNINNNDKKRGPRRSYSGMPHTSLDQDDYEAMMDILRKREQEKIKEDESSTNSNVTGDDKAKPSIKKAVLWTTAFAVSVAAAVASAILLVKAGSLSKKGDGDHEQDLKI